MKSHHYNIMFRPEPEGGYTVIVPVLPGCVSYGKSLEEAKKMAYDAIEAYVASLRKHHEPVPTDDETMLASLDFTSYAKTA